MAVADGGTLRARLGDPGPKNLWCGYVHAPAPGQDTVLEYRNMEAGPQEVFWSLMTLDGTLLPGGEGHQALGPGEFFRLEAGKTGRSLAGGSFQGQCALLFRQTDGGAARISPAVTSHWTSGAAHCEVGSQGFGRWNGPDAAARGRFAMFCPVICVDDRRTTVLVLFNHSTDPAYRDTVALRPLLSAAGGTVEGPEVRVPPFGAGVLDAAEHFGGEGRRLLAAAGGLGTVTASHAGHVLTSYFFHLDRTTGDVLSGQHTQPPASILRRKGIWWGRLRRWAP